MTSSEPPTQYLALDVECVAIGTRHCDRAVARVAIVDENEQTLLDRYVKPKETVVSCLTQLTGLTPENIENAPYLDDVLVEIRRILQPTTILVGHAVHHDVKWLNLQINKDFGGMYDMSQVFAIDNPPGSLFPRRLFSLRHAGIQLLGEDVQAGTHSPVADALCSMRLFKKYRSAPPGLIDAVKQSLLRSRAPPSFAKMFPYVDGVAMVWDPACVNCAMPVSD